ncbi:MAG: DUF4860 domain-containing protein [Oscillospiraceae bacterium]|jgi:hypothetical protein|nr:DUF4860 domain-containing protein [Oscillospiraceae bacterium]
MKKIHRIDALFILLLYAMFALLSALSVIIGVQVYKGLVEDSANRGELRTALSYVANRFRAADTASGVTLERRGGVNALVFREQLAGRRAETLIYCYDGALREYLLVPDLGGQGFVPAEGDELVAVSDFSVTRDAGLYTIFAKTESGAEARQQVFRRTTVSG